MEFGLHEISRQRCKRYMYILFFLCIYIYTIMYMICIYSYLIYIYIQGTRILGITFRSDADDTLRRHIPDGTHMPWWHIATTHFLTTHYPLATHSPLTTHYDDTFPDDTLPPDDALPCDDALWRRIAWPPDDAVPCSDGAFPDDHYSLTTLGNDAFPFMLHDPPDRQDPDA